MLHYFFFITKRTCTYLNGTQFFKEWISKQIYVVLNLGLKII